MFRGPERGKRSRWKPLLQPVGIPAPFGGFPPPLHPTLLFGTWSQDLAVSGPYIDLGGTKQAGWGVGYLGPTTFSCPTWKATGCGIKRFRFDHLSWEQRFCFFWYPFWVWFKDKPPWGPGSGPLSPESLRSNFFRRGVLCPWVPLKAFGTNSPRLGAAAVVSVHHLPGRLRLALPALLRLRGEERGERGAVGEPRARAALRRRKNGRGKPGERTRKEGHGKVKLGDVPCFFFWWNGGRGGGVEWGSCR